jgi:hypothetical protein
MVEVQALDGWVSGSDRRYDGDGILRLTVGHPYWLVDSACWGRVFSCAARDRELASSARLREEVCSVRRILLTVVLIVSFLGVAATPAAAPEWCPASMTSSNLRIGSERYVAAELSWTGDRYAQLRARTPANSVGPWEVFRLVCVQGPDVYAIKSVANGRYVSAEISWTGNRYGLLRARATTIGPWEQFRIPNSGQLKTIFSLANNRYVSAELSWTGDSYASLRARATTAGSWEHFPFRFS